MKKVASIIIAIFVVLALGILLFDYSKGEPIQTAGDFKTHQSEEFSFRYPSNWFVYDRPENINSFVLTTLANYDIDVLVTSSHPSGNYYKIEIVKLTNSERLSLTSWVDQFVKNSPTEPFIVDQKPLIVDGLEAIYNLERAWGVTHPAIYISRGDSIYIINSAPITPEFESVLDDFINSFKFIY